MKYSYIHLPHIEKNRIRCCVFIPTLFWKNKKINKACLSILVVHSSASVAADYFHRLSSHPCHTFPCWLFLTSFAWSHLGQMEFALQHASGVKLHYWLASLTTGMRPVRKHQSDSSLEDVLTHHRLRRFCEGWLSMNSVSVVHSHLDNRHNLSHIAVQAEQAWVVYSRRCLFLTRYIPNLLHKGVLLLLYMACHLWLVCPQ